MLCWLCKASNLLPAARKEEESLVFSFYYFELNILWLDYNALEFCSQCFYAIFPLLKTEAPQGSADNSPVSKHKQTFVFAYSIGYHKQIDNGSFYFFVF